MDSEHNGSARLSVPTRPLAAAVAGPAERDDSHGEQLGSVRIARRVLRTVVERAALGVPGVVHMANGGESWWRRLTRDWPEHGVGLSLHGVSVRLALYLIAEPGVNLVDVGTAVQEAVGAAVERILGLEIGEINVYIQDVA
jgi:uncharacterized alkaline shock family protein YloU